MKRPQSKWQMRKMAMLRFALRNRRQLAVAAAREPACGETALSPAEVEFGITRGLMAPRR